MNKQYKTITLTNNKDLEKELNNIPKNYELVQILPAGLSHNVIIIIREM